MIGSLRTYLQHLADKLGILMSFCVCIFESMATPEDMYHVRERKQPALQAAAAAAVGRAAAAANASGDTVTAAHHEPART